MFLTIYIAVSLINQTPHIQIFCATRRQPKPTGFYTIYRYFICMIKWQSSNFQSERYFRYLKKKKK